jgi:N-acetylglucosaminyldiphosphoundecaprenol N-acetyl-beta-D-mannosaminyltransferase
MSQRKVARIVSNIIGVPVDVGDFALMVDRIIELASTRTRGYVCVTNVHMLVLARKSGEFRQILDRALTVVADGMPLVWIQRLNKFANAQRVNGPDLMYQLCERAAEMNLPVYFYGGKEDTLGTLTATLISAFPNLIVAGAEAPPLLPERPLSDKSVTRRINLSGANLVFVGLGCPKQEYWAAAYAPQVSAVIIGVGAAFDFLAGRKRRAPKWLQRCGLEWLHRLATEPRRLWRRYLIGNSAFAWYLLVQFLDQLKRKY